ncbi:MAG TPA: universal stress protein [Gammaproteobacteria bacterium]|jgi:universal stress protein A|uniref:universal stress protein n=1 Tax=Immundisolibacter sp. TaxID=1934948 RepID=UPI000E833D6B|nr:universal stress protein [Gammaproteobacteria bacterium]HCZ48022.1 universal stress protein [Gammaproteobacteria bacterium]MCH77460.1 universal stress protein [Gammaproteobacteria bacterium]
MQQVAIRRIVVPLDFSDPALGALSYAASLGQTFGAELVLTYVAEPPPFAPDLTESHGYEQRVAARAEANLRELTQTHVDQGAKARYVVRFGRPAQEIAALAREEQADLIIIATHGRSGLKHLVGSVTEKLVRLASCPVLVTHHGRDQTPQPD